MDFSEYQVAVGKQHPHLIRLYLPPDEFDQRLHTIQRTLYDLALQAETLDIPLATLARRSLKKDTQT